ncbi:8-oxo-dGTP diphosphatase [Sulfuritortus calidifontis]|uniref:8-oxo-dGTP diphosphatase n=1 Tax=Sulfuritortus calidifontis TaxID=1914471 RepID=A0A4R3JT53_9PROT|nr:8-oxo-dGTP diphosphatase [Sulfuritortus calidifontis]
MSLRDAPRTEVAAAVIERPDGSFLMACRPEGKAYAGWWEFPGGKVEAGETAREALVRELEEELGIAVTGAYPWISRCYDYPHAQVNLRFFRVTGWQGEPQPHEGQQLAWTHASRPEVEPILPANGPILRGLSLPLVYAISDAENLGVDIFLKRLDERLAAGLRLVQLREKAMPSRDFEALARAVAERCRAAGAQLLINGDIELARALGVGVHLGSKQWLELKQRPELSWVGASCHDAGELARAVELGADLAVLSPVLPTASHPGAPTLGWPRFAELVAHSPIPVFALGGLAENDLDLARRHGAHGVALKGWAWR